MFYKIGMLKIFELCVKVEDVLGDKFDICVFYDVIFGNGVVLLNILECMVDDWIVL